MEERTMDVIEKFGNRVSSQALKDPEKARRLLLAGYRLQEKSFSFCRIGGCRRRDSMWRGWL